MTKKTEQPETEEITEDVLEDTAQATADCPLVAEIIQEEKAEKAEETKELAKSKGVDADFFYNNVFKLAFNASGTLLKYESLKISEAEELGARATSDEIFKLVESTPALGFLCKVDWIERYSLVAFFVVTKAMAVRAEYKDKHPTEKLPAPAEEPKKETTSDILG